MNQETVAAKTLLNGGKLTSYATYDDSTYGIAMYGKCPACGENGGHFFDNKDDGYICICPNTGAKVYAIYG